ncbi:hypothetical protein PSP31120_04858 [Pandoraea sputorum]|nr:hypothetical protein PSP31120_04858 [Pandoraea sputorum]
MFVHLFSIPIYFIGFHASTKYVACNVFGKKSGRPNDVDDSEDVGAKGMLSCRSVAAARSREGRATGLLWSTRVADGKSTTDGRLDGLTSSLQIGDLWNEANNVPDDRA